MRILVISQYFWPENFRINELCKHLAKKNKLTVLTSKPTYPNSKLFEKTRNLKKFESIKIIRLPTYLRDQSNFSIILNYLSFIIFSVIYSIKFIFNSNFDKILVFGTSPPSGLLAAHIIRIFKKIPVYYWILDLWPETLNSVGFSKRNLIFIILEKFMNYSYSKCKFIFCQSKSIQSLISKKIRNKKKAIYFPSWSENLPLHKNQKLNKLINKRDFNIMFTGNIGQSQDFESVVNAAKILEEYRNIKWIIVGEGRFLYKLKLLINKKNLEKKFIFLGSQKLKYIKYLSSLSSCLLICLKKNKIFSITVPGKLSNYMECKKPILGMISGETKEIIEMSKSGYCCDAGDYKTFSKNILKLNKKTINQQLKIGYNGYIYSKKFFNKKILFRKFEKHLLI